MFAPKVAKPQTTTAESPADKPAHQRSQLVADRSGYDAVALVRMLQTTMGDQATARLPAMRPENPAADVRRDRPVQKADRPAREAPAVSSWNFGKIAISTPGLAPRPDKVGALDAEQSEAGSMADPLRQKGAAERGNGSALTMVEAVLHSPGQILDPAVRNFTETRFGHDFSQVKIHTDARAAESARGVNALAYTSGNHIAFDAGQYAPQTRAGMRLLSHELTHVVQQRHAPFPARGLGVPGDFHERQAGAVADAVMRGGDIAGLLDSGPGPIPHVLQRQPAPPPPPQPLTYDRTIYHPKPVPPGLTAAMVKQQLADKVKRGEITSFTTKGGTGNAEIFLLAILFALADHNRWHTEADLVTAIDWPAKPSDPAPLGQVTVRIDSRGAASAELIARGAPAVTQQISADALRTKYKLASVKDDGTASWGPDELNDVAEALAMLPPDDKAALEDVELIRVDKISGKPTWAGQFDFPHPAAADPEAVKRHATLSLATIAFTHDTLQFFGGTAKTVPASFEVILHEVGHAVESDVYRSKWRAHAQALADTKAAGNIQESDARKKERKEVEDKLKTTQNPAEKDRLEKRLAKFDLDLALAADKATDKKAAETKLKEKEKEVLDMDSGSTQRLTKFLDLVNKNHIAPFTDYSKEGDSEFYAEAYSLWLVDPEFMRTNYKVVFDFFQNGDYRK